MIQYLEDLKGVGIPPLTSLEKQELEKLRKEHLKLKLKYESMETKVQKKGAIDSDGSSEEDVKHYLNE